MTYLLTALVVLAGAGMAFAVLERMIQRSLLSLALVLIATALPVFLPGAPVHARVGPFNLYLFDALSTLLAIAAVARLLRARRLNAGQGLLVLLAGLALLSLGSGIMVFGLENALIEFRKFYNFLAPALYFSTVEVRRDLFDAAGKAVIVAGGALLGLAAFRFAVLPLGLSGGIYGYGDIRVIWAAEALLLAQVLFVSAHAWRRTESALWARFALALLVAVVLVQHRTVWICVLAGVAVMALRDHAIARRFGLLLAGGVSGAVFVAVVFGGTSEVSEQLANSAQSEGTFIWRYEGWRTLLEGGGVSSPGEAVVGQPFGTGWSRELYGQIIEVSPHNFYIETYLRMGLLGLAFLVTLYVRVLVRLARGHGLHATLLGSEVLLVIIASQLLYYITYSPSPVDGVLLGLATTAAFAGTQRDQERPLLRDRVVAQ